MTLSSVKAWNFLSLSTNCGVFYISCKLFNGTTQSLLTVANGAKYFFLHIQSENNHM